MMWSLIQGWIQLFAALALGAGFLALLATGLIFLVVLLAPLLLWAMWEIHRNRKTIRRPAPGQNLDEGEVITVEYVEVPSSDDRKLP